MREKTAALTEQEERKARKQKAELMAAKIKEARKCYLSSRLQLYRSIAIACIWVKQLGGAKSTRYQTATKELGLEPAHHGSKLTPLAKYLVGTPPKDEKAYKSYKAHVSRLSRAIASLAKQAPDDIDFDKEDRAIEVIISEGGIDGLLRPKPKDDAKKDDPFDPAVEGYHGSLSADDLVQVATENITAMPAVGADELREQSVGDVVMCMGVLEGDTVRPVQIYNAEFITRLLIRHGVRLETRQERHMYRDHMKAMMAELGID
jgi:hypothetical protein